MNAHMLGAYYTKGLDSSSMFEKLLIAGTENYEKHRNKHNVIVIDFSRMPDMCKTYQVYIDAIKTKLQRDLQSAFPTMKVEQDVSLSEIFKATGEFYIFILDEWDYLIQGL